jgi:hypothetical protein
LEQDRQLKFTIDKSADALITLEKSFEKDRKTIEEYKQKVHKLQRRLRAGRKSDAGSDTIKTEEDQDARVNRKHKDKDKEKEKEKDTQPSEKEKRRSKSRLEKSKKSSFRSTRGKEVLREENGKN